MGRFIGSSWNSDRVAGSLLNKERKARQRKLETGIKVYETKDLYTREYGKAAYAAWCEREEEINRLMMGRTFDRARIVGLRETSFRLMKSGCTQRDLNLDKYGFIQLRPQVCGRIAPVPKKLAA